MHHFFAELCEMELQLAGGAPSAAPTATTGAHAGTHGDIATFSMPELRQVRLDLELEKTSRIRQEKQARPCVSPCLLIYLLTYMTPTAY